MAETQFFHVQGATEERVNQKLAELTGEGWRVLSVQVIGDEYGAARNIYITAQR